jgi:hypothetical protein
MMKIKNRPIPFRIPTAALGLLLAAAGALHAAAPHQLTYQGRLKESGLPVTATRSIELQLCDSLTAGICYPTGPQSIVVVNGLFRTTFTVPSPVALESGAWYIEVIVGATAFSPREMLTASPYAIYASSASTLVAAPGASSVVISTVVSIAAQSAAGYSLVLSSGVSAPAGTINAKYFVGSGAYLTGVASIDNTKVAKTGDSMTGNLNLINANLNLTGANGRVVSASSITASAFFGDGSNLTGVTATGGVLKIGDTMTGQLTNTSTITVQGNAFSVGGSTFVVIGSSVGIGTAAPQAALHVIGRIIHTTGIVSDGLGYGTAIGTARGQGAVDLQTFRSLSAQVASGQYAVVGGGQLNTAGNSGATVSGGVGNQASGPYATVSGGSGNLASNNYSTVNGGVNNGVSGYAATIPGGNNNAAGGDYSFAAGRQAKANAIGSYVWADSAGIDLINSIPDQFLARAMGGFDIQSSSFIFANGVSTYVYIQNNGNVSIGAVSPSTFSSSGALALAPNAALTLSGPSGFINAQSSVNASAFFGNGAGLTGLSGVDSSKVAKIGDTMTGQLTLAGSSSMTVTGAVGIGAAGLANGTLVVQSTSTTGANPVADFRNNAGVSIFQVQQGGNVGIGTTNPAAKLELVGGDILMPNGYSLRARDSVGSGYSMISLDGLNKFQVGTVGGSFPMILNAGAAERMRIDNSGNVGIATATPTAVLDVNGNAEFGSGGTKSTFTALGALALAKGSALTLSGATGNIVSGASITASGFFGDGGGLTNLPVSGGAVAKIGDTMTGALKITGTTDVVQMTIKASPAQLLDLHQWQSNTGAILARVAADGSLYATTMTATSFNIGVSTVLSLNPAGTSVRIGAGDKANGAFNVFVGSSAGAANIGSRNTYVGFEAGLAQTAGPDNVFIGHRAGVATVNGTGENSFIGSDAGFSNVTGYDNTYVGRSAGRANVAGNSNVVLGYQAGFILAGGGNVLLGNQAGFSETGSNKLYIANSPSNNLIYGDFPAGLVGINTTAPSTSLDVNGSAQFGSGAAKSTFTASGALSINTGSALSLSGPNGFINAQSSVNASAFFGDGAGLVGVIATIGANTINTIHLINGAVDSTKLAVNSVNAANIAAGAIDSSKLAAGSVDTNKILDGAVTDAKIVGMSSLKLSGPLPSLNGAALTGLTAANIAAGTLGAGVIATTIANGVVDSSKLATNAVNTVNIVNGAVDSGKLAANAVNTVNIVAGSVDSSKLALASVDSGKLAANSVNTVNIVNGAIDSSKLALGSVDSGKLANNSVNTVNIVAGSVDTNKLAAGSVDTNKLAADAVTTVKILDGAVTAAKLGALSLDSTKLATDAVTTIKILDGAVTLTKLATGSVDSSKIVAFSITSGQLAANSVNSVQIAGNAVTPAQLAPNSVTAVAILNGTIDSSKLASGSVDSGKLAANAVNTANIVNGAVDSSKLAFGAVDTSKIAASATAGQVLTTVGGLTTWATPVEANTFTSSKTFTSDIFLRGTGVISASSATLTYGIIAGTGTFTSSVTIQGNAFSVGTSSFTVGGGSATVAYQLKAGSILTLGNLTATGTTGGVAISGTGTRFMWVPALAALRAGEVSATEWDLANVGSYSVAFGQNTRAAGSNSTVSGGLLNATTRPYSTIAGGYNNFIGSSGDYSFIGAGYQNSTTGNYAVVPGGINNTASGAHSFAGGQQAKALANGSFVWADTGGAGTDLVSTIPDQFFVRAMGGFDIRSSSFVFANSVSTLVYIRNDGNVGIGTTNPGSPLHLLGNAVDEAVTIEQTVAGNNADIFLKTTGGANDFLQLVKHGPSAGGTTAGVAISNLSRVTAGATAGPLMLQVVTSNPMYFVTNNVERMRIDSAGNVGIGGAPFAVLDVRGTPTVNNPHVMFGEGTATSGAPSSKLTFAGNGIEHAGIFWTPVSAGVGKLQFATGGSADPSVNTVQMTIQNNGKVGIRDPNPSYELAFNGSVGPQTIGVEDVGANGAGAGLLLRAGAGGTTTGGQGGDVSILAGNGGAGNTNGGMVNLSPGSPTGLGTMGSVLINGGGTGTAHLKTFQTTPPSIVPSACGAAPAPTLSLIGGNSDMSGFIQIIPGGATATCTLTVTFTKPYGNVNPLKIMVLAANPTANGLGGVYAVPSAMTNTASFSVTFGGTSSSTYQFTYLVIE